MPSSLASGLLGFYRHLKPPTRLPKGVGILFPQQHEEVMRIVRIFLYKYYDDSKPRRLLLGINPGRFGAGITGVNFTAPRQLKHFCGIDHSFGESSELSAEFIYEVIERYGRPASFYRHHFISSVCPLGFVLNKVNMNYYDSGELQEAVRPFIIESIKKTLDLGFKRDRCLCVGG